jgi:hypothetical protein
MTDFDGTLADLDAAVRQQRQEARAALQEGDDATFALVNPDFAEGFAWYNAVQATRPMGWTIDCSGTVNIKESRAAKGDLIAADQSHLQLWGINGEATVSQTVTGLPDGQYEVSATVVTSGSLTASLFAQNTTASITDSNIYKVQATVSDETLRFGITVSSTVGATIDFDDFRLTTVNNTNTAVREIENGKMNNENTVYDLQGRRVNFPSSIVNSQLKKGLLIIDGKKVVVR